MKHLAFMLAGLVFLTQSVHALPDKSEVEQAACNYLKTFNENTYNQEVIAAFYFAPEESLMGFQNPHAWDTNTYVCSIDDVTYTDYDFTLSISMNKSTSTTRHSLTLNQNIGCTISAGTYDWVCYYDFIDRSEEWLSIGVQQT